MRTERPGHTLQTTALVNETYLRLAAQRVPIENRSKFFALAARLMRRVLVDHARARAATRRGGDQVRVTLGPANDGQVEPGPVDLLALEQALERLSLKDPRQTRIVELRFFAGLTIPETAEVVGVSHTIVEREWALARAWLQRELRSTTA
jgi:RNA polymerase sigma factor (TIGR02999 family)